MKNLVPEKLCVVLVLMFCVVCLQSCEKQESESEPEPKAKAEQVSEESQGNDESPEAQESDNAETNSAERTGGDKGDQPEMAADLELVCNGGSVPADAAPDKKQQLWAESIAQKLGPEGLKLFKSLEVSTEDYRCKRALEGAAKLFDSEWSCPRLCAVQARFGPGVLGDVKVPRSTSDSIVEGEYELLIVTDSEVRDSDGRASALKEDGAFALPPGVEGGKQWVVIADEEVQHATLQRVADAARERGVQRLGLVTNYLGDTLDYEAASTGFRADGLNPAFDEERSAPFQNDGRVVWLNLDLGEEDMGTTIMIAKDGFWILRGRDPEPPIRKCGRMGPTICLAAPHEKSFVERYDYLELYNAALGLQEKAGDEPLVISAGADIPLPVLVATLDSVRHVRVLEGGEPEPFVTFDEFTMTSPAVKNGKTVPLMANVVLARSSSSDSAGTEKEGLLASDETTESLFGSESKADQDSSNSAFGNDFERARGRVTFGKPSVTGDLSERIVKKVAQVHTSELVGCYEAELEKTPDLAGEITVKWTIDQDGNVPSATVVSSSINNRVVEACLPGSIKKWRFPATGDGGLVIVSYPFAFEPR